MHGAHKKGYSNLGIALVANIQYLVKSSDGKSGSQNKISQRYIMFQCGIIPVNIVFPRVIFIGL